MSKDTTKVTVGNGDLYLNNVEVGHLKGDVEISYKRENVGFKPSNMLAEVTQFVIKEECMLKASLAELKLSNLKLALGLATAIVTNTSYPADDPSSYTVPAGTSYDVLHFGGSKAVAEMSLRFEHTRKDGKKIILVLYKAVSLSDLTLPFKEEDVVLMDVQFKAMADATRADGDNLGFIVEQSA